MSECESCGDIATHTGWHWEAGWVRVCYPCTVGQQFSNLESLAERDERARKTLSIIREQEKEVQP